MKTTGRARSALSVLLALAMWWTVMTNLITAAGTSSPVLTLEAVQGELAGPASKHGSKVGSIGKNGGEREGTVTFRDLALPADGYYTLRLLLSNHIPFVLGNMSVTLYLKYVFSAGIILIHYYCNTKCFIELKKKGRLP